MAPPSPGPGEPKLAADAMLGSLARWLRLLGLDTVYLRRGPRPADPARVLLTRRTDRPHQPRLSGWRRIIRIEAGQTAGQLTEALTALGLTRADLAPWTRCSLCNLCLEPADRTDLAGLAPDYVLATQPVLARCPECRRVYWPGTHYQRMAKLIEALSGISRPVS